MNLKCTKCAAGFTLIEVLVAVVVVALGCLAVLAFHSSAIRSGSQADTLTVASFLGESQIERLRSIQFDGIETAVRDAASRLDNCDSSGDIFDDCDVCYSELLNRAGNECENTEGRGCFRRSTGLFLAEPTTRSHTVRVAVQWRGPTNNHIVTYDSMVSAFGYTGE